jgi:uncharacterized Tic20 family protein
LWVDLVAVVVVVVAVVLVVLVLVWLMFALLQADGGKGYRALMDWTPGSAAHRH